MKVTAIKTYMFTAQWRNWLFVKVETDEGIYGWGEGSTEGREMAVQGAIKHMESYLVGKDPRQVERHWSTMFRDGYWRAGAIMCSAMSALDMAMWDIKGKTLGVPVYELLGGPVHDRIRFYGNGWYIGADSIERFVEMAQAAVEAGTNALKFDPFWECDVLADRALLDRGVDIVRAVREAVGDDVELLIEVHGRLSPANAIYAAKGLEELKPYFYEEPIPPDNVDAMALVARSTSIPIATGERLYTRWGFRELLEKQAAAIIQPDHTHTGGITEGKKIAAMAEVYYVGVAPHNATGPILTATNLQLDAALSNFLIQEFFFPDMPIYDKVLKENFIVMKDGYLDLPKKPGLGVEVNEEYIKSLPYKPDIGLGMMWAPMNEIREAAKRLGLGQ